MGVPCSSLCYQLMAAIFWIVFLSQISKVNTFVDPFSGDGAGETDGWVTPSPDDGAVWTTGGRCVDYGDSHTHSFDSGSRTFSGQCTYLLAGSTTTAETSDCPQFEVLETKELVNNQVMTTSLQLVFPDNGPTTIGITSRTLTIDSIRRYGNFDATFAGSSGNPTVTCQFRFYGLYVRVTCSCGIHVTFGENTVHVCLPVWYKDKTDGMCGDFGGTFERDPHCFNEGLSAYGTDFKECKDPSTQTCTENDAPPTCADQEAKAVFSICGVIESTTGPFQACIANANSVPYDDYFSDCKLDACLYGDAAKCSAIRAYALECEFAGSPGIDWQTVTGCGVTCSGGKIYSNAGSTCANTCSAPTASTTCSTTTEGCFCPAGQLEFGDQCLDPNACPCVDTEGISHNVDESWLSQDCTLQYTCNAGATSTDTPTISSITNPNPCTGTETCLVVSGLGSCVADKTVANVVGDPHHLTLDGKAITYQGTCKYLLSATLPTAASQGLQDYQILVQNVLRAGSGQRAVMDYMEFFVPHVVGGRQVETIFKVDYLKRIWVTDPISLVQTRLFPFQTYSIMSSTATITITPHAQYLCLFTSFGLTIYAGGYYEVVAYISSQYNNHVYGMWGNFDLNSQVGDPWCQPSPGVFTTSSADCTVPDPTISCTSPTTDVPHPCTTDQDLQAATTNCELAVKKNGVFQTCIDSNRVNQNYFYDTCIYDTCIGIDQPAEVKCKTLESMAFFCEQRGFKVDWRAGANCIPTCAAGFDYRIDAPGCPPTCSMPDPSVECPLAAADACVCQGDTVLHGDSCVAKDQCPCVVDGEERQVGSTWISSDCSQQFTCTASAQDVPSVTTAAYACTSPEVCQVFNGVYGCYSPTNYRCMVYGNLHYYTFDRNNIAFNGLCAYTLLAPRPDATTLEDFSITAKNRKGIGNVVYLDEVTINLEGTAVKIDSLNRDIQNVYVNDVTVLPNYEVALGGGRTVRVEYQGLGLRVVTSYGLVAMITKGLAIQIIAPFEYRSKIYGLCGNWDFSTANQDPSCLKQDGTESSISGDCDLANDGCDHQEIVTADCTQALRDSYTATCDDILSNRVFDDCFTELDKDVFKANCVNDACSGDSPQESICLALEMAGNACAQIGKLVQWRDLSTECAFTCPTDLYFSASVTGCQQRCDDPELQSPCPWSNVEGCICRSPELVYRGEQCRPAAECPCEAAGDREYVAGQSWYNTDCTQLSQCTTTGTDTVPNIQNLDTSCGADQTCSQIGSDYSCVYTPVAGGWGDWTQWSTCQSDNVNEFVTRTRECNNPPPAHGGAQCPTADAVDTRNDQCTVNGAWTDWMDWEACSTLYQGTRIRQRTCTNPAPAGSGSQCPGVAQESEDCGCFFPYNVQNRVVLPSEDEARSEAIPIEQGFQFGGHTHTHFYMYANGIISFDQPLSEMLATYGTLPVTDSVAIVAPYLVDIDLSGGDLAVEDNVAFYSTYMRTSTSTSVSATEQEIFDRATEAIRQTLDDEFLATHVIVCTWINVAKFPAMSASSTGRASFQVVLMQDFQKYRSYVLYLYGANTWPRFDPPSISIGYRSQDNSQNAVLYDSTDTRVYDLNSLLDSTRSPGEYICVAITVPYHKPETHIPYMCGISTPFPLTSPAQENPNSPNYLCLRWAESQNLNIILAESIFYPACPCRRWQAVFDPRYVRFPFAPRMCFVTRSFSRITGIFGSRICCYESTSNLAPLVTERAFKDPLAKYFGQITKYNPQRFPRSYWIEDLLPKALCCFLSDNCALYYTYRPHGNCLAYNPPRIIIALGDPHIGTADGKEYTFNGLGEYSLILSSDDSITLQGRTGLIETVDGSDPRATVFTGFAAKGKDSETVFVGLDDDRAGMHVFVNGETDHTAWLYTDPDPTTDEVSEDITGIIKDPFSNPAAALNMIEQDQGDPNTIDDNNGLTLTKVINGTERTLVVTFTGTGVSLRITASAGTLMCETTLVESLSGKLLGLYGNYDGDPNNDFINRDGVLLDSTMTDTEEKIYKNFGETWRISSEESLFLYKPGKTYTDINVPSFVPRFGLEGVSQAKIDEANAACDSNKQCVYDLIQTGSVALATTTKEAMNTAMVNNENVKNNPPRILVNGVREESTWLLSVGAESSYDITASDNDVGDTTTVILTGRPPDATFETSTGKFTWTPKDRMSHTLRFTATDSRGAMGVALEPTIAICDCNGHATCDINNLESGYKKTDKFQIVKCQCNRGWTGQRCETDIDGCANEPCGVGIGCADVPGAEHQASGEAFTCTSCGPGLQVLDKKCLDIDECTSADKNDCDTTKSKCVNTLGSYTCSCNSGFTQVTGSTKQCDDLDECKLQLATCDQTCVNNEGSYKCDCHLGYTLNLIDETTCTPLASVDAACKALATPCQHTCVSKPGTTEVECACRSGYTLNADGISCDGVNECQASTNPCGPNSQCTDATPGYTCSCDIGYKLHSSGRSCEACDKFTWGVNCNKECRCKTPTTECRADSGCQECPQGYRGGECKDDIDECTENPNICPALSTCQDTDGKYLCNCNDGYVKSNGVCVLDDYCDKDTTACQHGGVCNATFMNYTCSCVSGYEGFYCEGNIDECASNPCQNGGTCRDMVDYFLCDCPGLYTGGNCGQEKTSLRTFSFELPGTDSTTDQTALATAIKQQLEEYLKVKYGDNFKALQAISFSGTPLRAIASAAMSSLFMNSPLEVGSDYLESLRRNSYTIGNQPMNPETLTVNDVKIPGPSETTTVTPTDTPSVPGLTTEDTRVVTIGTELTQDYVSEMASPTTTAFTDVSSNAIPALEDIIKTKYGDKFLGLVNVRISNGFPSAILNAEAAFSLPFDTADSVLSDDINSNLAQNNNQLNGVAVKNNRVTANGTTLVTVPLSFKILNWEWHADLADRSSARYIELRTGLYTQLASHLQVAHHKIYCWTQDYVFTSGSVNTALNVATLGGFDNADVLRQNLMTKVEPTDGFLGNYQLLPSSIVIPGVTTVAPTGISDNTLIGVIVGSLLGLLFLILLVLLILICLRRRTTKKRKARRYLEEEMEDSSSRTAYSAFMYPRRRHWMPVDGITRHTQETSFFRDDMDLQSTSDYNTRGAQGAHVNWNVLRGYSQQPTMFNHRGLGYTEPTPGPSDEFIWLPSGNGRTHTNI